MTGVVCRAMKLSKRAALAGLALGVMSTAQANPVSVTVPVTANFLAPTCTVSSSPSSINLGTLMAGSSGDHSTGVFTLTLSCNGTVNSRLYASIPGGSSSGALSGSNTLRMSVNNTVPANTATVQLVDTSYNSVIQLNGNSSIGTFCSGSSTWRQCSLRPRYTVPANTATGNASASITFNVAYY